MLVLLETCPEKLKKMVKNFMGKVGRGLLDDFSKNRKLEIQKYRTKQNKTKQNKVERNPPASP